MVLKDVKVIALYSKYSFQLVMENPGIFVAFLISKLLRLGLFLAFLVFLFRQTSQVAGYTGNQIIFFFLSFNLIDTAAQLFFREVYRFRPLIVSGNFDFILVKPSPPLARVLLGGPDVIDLIMLFIFLILTVWFAVVNFHPDYTAWILYFSLLFSGLIIAAAFHILVLSLGLITMSIDHLILIYRDLTSLMRIPVGLYVEPVRFILTFLIPIGLMMSFPPQALFGLLSTPNIFLSFLFAVVTILLSLRLWSYCLRFYQSASS